jgi:hypothetical protein
MARAQRRYVIVWQCQPRHVFHPWARAESADLRSASTALKPLHVAETLDESIGSCVDVHDTEVGNLVTDGGIEAPDDGAPGIKVPQIRRTEMQLLPQESVSKRKRPRFRESCREQQRHTNSETDRSSHTKRRNYVCPPSFSQRAIARRAIRSDSRS